MDSSVDISIILNLHNEGYTATPTLRSITRAIIYLKEHDISTELILVLDKGDEKTKRFMNKDADKVLAESSLTEDYSKFHIQKIETSYGDLGLARNQGTQIAKGSYLNFIDGDNIVDRKWFYKAYQYMQIQDNKEKTILHPQLYFSFGSERNVWLHVQKQSISYSPLSFLKSNYWDSMCFASRQLFEAMPYQATNSLKSGLGFEDWHWNCETLAAGYIHEIVPDTLYHYKKAYDTTSMAWRYTINKNIIPYSEYFNKTTFCNLKEKEEYDGRYTKEELDRSYFIKLSEVLSRDFVIEAYRDIRYLEPRIVSTLQRNFVQPVPSANRNLGSVYIELIKNIDENYDYVLLSPWAKTGGALKVLENYAKGIKNFDPTKRILVVFTVEFVNNSYRNDNFDFICFGNLTNEISHEDKIELLTRLLIQMRPRVIHNVSSLLGFETFKLHGPTLSFYSSLFATTFTFDDNNPDQYYSYGSEFYNEIEPYIKAFSTDNKYFNDKMLEIYGLPKDKFYVHYQPVIDIPKKAKLRNRSHTFNILWASRIDKEKRPDILYKIADTLQGKNIQFHIFGNSVLNDMSAIKKQLKALTNVRLYGEYESFEAIEPEHFDIFLYTSQSDGMPNVVLEAIYAMLPVIAPKIGGIPELIIDRETGILIEENDDINAYVEAILELKNDKHLRRKLTNNAFALVNKYFRESAFLESLTSFSNYLK
ncbi:glycosyltransferase [Candidatus Nomurabacteria bacterium]|nr:glycosyltransferase [Candidatus Nomurabacteria bacterium]